MSAEPSEGRNQEETRKSVLQMSADEAREFLLKGQSYCNFDLPPYIAFDTLLSNVDKHLRGKGLKSMAKPGSPRDFDDLNHTILNNKDGKFAWRPMQLTHPALYVSLVHQLTDQINWDFILKRFAFFKRNPQIECLSLPVESQTEKQDKAEQILQWWQEVEQRSVELSLEYEYLAQTDITDCYGSIYTHSVAWALNKRSVAKRLRKDRSLLGNAIDDHLQDINFGQTNGIPQGSVLMDLVAEIVLGYADFILTQRIRKSGITDYQILRYRDDYRIFTNHPTQGEEILKFISETMYFLGMKLHPSKTGLTSYVVRDSIKADKINWTGRKQSEKELQKHLLIIHDFAQDYPNSGSLMRALSEYHQRVLRFNDEIRNALPMIAIVVDIAVHNPKVYAMAAAILSKLICSISLDSDRREILLKIKKRFERVPNTGHLQLWLQRISHHHDPSHVYTEELCQLVQGETPVIWNNDWISCKGLIAKLNPKKILNKSTLRQLKPVVPVEEVQLFESRISY